MKLCATLLLIPCLCLAEYDTNIFPTYKAFRAPYRQMRHLYTSVWEHADVINKTDATGGFSDPDNHDSFRGYWRRSDFIDMKDSVKGGIDCSVSSEVDVSDILTNLSQYVYYYGAVTGQSRYIIHNTVTGACIRAELPTNVLDYTPYRGWNCTGPFFSDTNLPSGHGWTNEFTQNGGTDFPAGRTQWYTSDYGMDAIRKLLDYIYITEQWYVEYISTTGGTALGYGDTYTEALDDAADSYATSVTSGSWYGSTWSDRSAGSSSSYSPGGSSEWDAKMWGSSSVLAMDRGVSRWEVTYDTFVMANIPRPGLDCATTNTVFDDNGDSYIFGWTHTDTFTAPTNFGFSTNYEWTLGHVDMSVVPSYAASNDSRGYLIGPNLSHATVIRAVWSNLNYAPLN